LAERETFRRGACLVDAVVRDSSCRIRQPVCLARVPKLRVKALHKSAIRTKAARTIYIHQMLKKLFSDYVRLVFSGPKYSSTGLEPTS